MNQINSIPKATNRIPTRLKAGVPFYSAIAVTQDAVPGTVRRVLRRTPPETVVANVVERPIGDTETARKT